MERTKKIRILISTCVILILLVISGGLYTFIQHYPEQIGKNLLEKYGWQVLSVGALRSVPVTLENEFLSMEITQMQVDASKEIGINPEDYAGKVIKQYGYQLKQIGIKDPLRADVWMVENKIICAYIYHAENNMKIKFWSLDTSYQDILSTLKADDSVILTTQSEQTNERTISPIPKDIPKLRQSSPCQFMQYGSGEGINLYLYPSTQASILDTINGKVLIYNVVFEEDNPTQQWALVEYVDSEHGQGYKLNEQLTTDSTWMEIVDYFTQKYATTTISDDKMSLEIKFDNDFSVIFRRTSETESWETLFIGFVPNY